MGCASTSKSSQEPPAGDPWFRAAREADIVVLRGMIDGGKPVNFQSGVGMTALMMASRAGNPKTVQWLIENGASASVLDRDGQSALVYALVGLATDQKLEIIVDELIRAGADPFHVDSMGLLPVQQMLEQELDESLRKIRYSTKKPCDRMPKREGEMSLSQAARRRDKISLAEFFEAQGCW